MRDICDSYREEKKILKKQNDVSDPEKIELHVKHIKYCIYAGSQFAYKNAEKEINMPKCHGNIESPLCFLNSKE